MIVITGASDGLGLEVAKLYKAAGKKVVNVALEKSEAADVNIVCDMREGSIIQDTAQKIEQIEEPVEAIINCIGIYSNQKFGEINEAVIKSLMATNVKAPMLLISELIDRIKKDGADVLNVISTAGTQANHDNPPVYVASKWAERGFTLSLQGALKNTTSRVISFCPGGINTNLVEKAGDDTDTSSWMSPKAVATLIKQVLDLPKNMEVSEIIINRKSA